jgi:hypothetical protein
MDAVTSGFVRSILCRSSSFTLVYFVVISVHLHQPLSAIFVALFQSFAHCSTIVLIRSNLDHSPFSTMRSRSLSLLTARLKLSERLIRLMLLHSRPFWLRHSFTLFKRNRRTLLANSAHSPLSRSSMSPLAILQCDRILHTHTSSVLLAKTKFTQTFGRH